MSPERKDNAKPAGEPQASATPPESPTPPAPSPPVKAGLKGWRLWRFRLVAAFGVPLFLLALVEFGLRVAGYGYPTHFLLPWSEGGRELFVQNNQFGWRFFGPAMAREPDALAFPRAKPPRTVRIFVFGESAAYGDPQPDFGLPRMLQAMLELRHPGVKFEVINAAMTGINSNVILPIANDCAQADGDVWVVYMGNNEVVGPFGAGTVFGPQAPPVSMIRASLAVKATRLGQLFDSLRRRLHPPPSSKSEWGGMEMFLDQQVRADDPRMNAVYGNFQRNLADIIQAGRQHGAGVVVSTVGVNLRDSAPFASAHRPGLSAAELETWTKLYQQGSELQNKANSAKQAGAAADATSRFLEAAGRFREAARIDDRFAELRFRLGACALELGEMPVAQDQLGAARDLDTLRFRCDSRLNELIRRAVPAGGDTRVLLADAERAFAEIRPDGLPPGEELFYEHVHLTFIGNYVLAKTIAPQVDKLLPEKVVPPVAAGQPWPTGGECIKRLGWTDWSFQAAVTGILERLHDPPFTAQITHEIQLAHLSKTLRELLPANAMGASNSLQICQAAADAAPDDPHLRELLAGLKQANGDLAGAAKDAKRAVELLPTSAEDWSQLGLIAGLLHQYNEAADAFHKAIELDPEDVWSMYNLAQAYEKGDRRDDAIKEYRRAVATKPRFGPAWLTLGRVLDAAGNKPEAEKCYHLAITNRIHRAPELTELAKFCRDRGWFQDAVKIFDEAGQLNPGDRTLPYEAGRILYDLAQSAAKAGQTGPAAAFRAGAAGHFEQAVRIDPDFMQAHFLCGVVTDDPNVSVAHFREAVRIEPNVLQSRVNLGLALERAGKPGEALHEFEAILSIDPGNPLALPKAEALRKQLAAQPVTN